MRPEEKRNRMIFCQIFILFVSFLIVSELIGVIGYEGFWKLIPGAQTLSESEIFGSIRAYNIGGWLIVRKWPYFVFVTLVILGEFAIFRLKEKIFPEDIRKNG